MEAVATARDLQYLRHAIALAAAAKARGKHPFAALIVDDRDAILAEAGNAFGWPDGDATGHAELIAVREASRRFSPERLAQATLYSSAEPCAMCAGAVYWAGLRRVVYALSEARLRTLTGNHPENPTLALPCRELFARGQRAIVVVGPLLEDEAAAPHSASGGSWAGRYRRRGACVSRPSVQSRSPFPGGQPGVWSAPSDATPAAFT